MVAMYFYDLQPNLGGYAGGSEVVGLSEGLERLIDCNKFLYSRTGNVFITRKTRKFPISTHNIDFVGSYNSNCIIPKGLIIMRFKDVLFTTKEVSDIFNVNHNLILKKVQSLKSDLHVLSYLLNKAGVASL